MTEFGIFARIFPRDTPRDVGRAIAAAGYGTTQLNLSSFGCPTLPPVDQQPDWAEVARAFGDAGVRIWGVSATFNVIDPDVARRAAHLERAQQLIRCLPRIDVGVATMCTGTRSSESIWTPHPDNRSPAAWSDLRATLEPLLEAAEEAAVTLGVEPEPGNVVHDAAAAARLLRELGPSGSRIGIVLDPANLVSVPDLPAQDAILRSAFELLGSRVIAVHAKDSVPAGEYAAVGRGGLDWDLIADLHQALPRQVPVIVQDCSEADAPAVLSTLRRHWGSPAEHRQVG